MCQRNLLISDTIKMRKLGTLLLLITAVILSSTEARKQRGRKGAKPRFCKIMDASNDVLDFKICTEHDQKCNQDVTLGDANGVVIYTVSFCEMEEEFDFAEVLVSLYHTFVIPQLALWS